MYENFLLSKLQSTVKIDKKVIIAFVNAIMFIMLADICAETLRDTFVITSNYYPARLIPPLTLQHTTFRNCGRVGALIIDPSVSFTTSYTCIHADDFTAAGCNALKMVILKKTNKMRRRARKCYENENQRDWSKFKKVL